MSVRIVQGSIARSDVESIVEFIQKDSPESAIHFLRSVARTFSMLADAPDMGSPCPFRSTRLVNARIWTIKEFRRYVVLYRPIEGGIEILRVVHGSRDIDALLNEDFE
jgi:toxin ParE1/3/4